MAKQTSQKRIVEFIFGLWKISPILTWLMIISQIISTTLTAAIAPIFVSQLLTQIANGTATMTTSGGLLFGYGFVLFMEDVVIFRFTIAMAYIVESRMQSTVAKKIMNHLTAKSLGYHANRMSGGIVSNASKLTGSIERFWDTIIFTAVPIATTLISVCIALSFMFWQYSIALAILSVIVIVVIIKSQNAIAPVSETVAEKSSAMTAYFADVISNISAVKAFAGEKSELKQYDKIVNVWTKSMMVEMKKVIIMTASFGTMMAIMNISAFAAAILATEYHFASIGTIYLVINYTLSIVTQLWSVSRTTRNYLRIIGDASPMINTLDEEIEIKDPVSPAKLIIDKGKIEFNKVSFTHNENEQVLFKDFLLTVNPGEQIGLIGKSGSGKTSLTRLLLRFSDIDSGQILIDGQDITSVSQSDLRSVIAYVPQEPVLFHRSLRDNIAYGKPDASDDEIYQAAEKANAIDFIKNLPKGFDTMVGERGVKLSGGQRQRVAIARAILKNAPILVLDEATSALDSENEKLIQGALTKLMANRTSIVIAHRLSTIAKMNRIIVLDDGKIVEQGSHSDLLKNGGIYAKLWSHQSGGFIEE